MLKNRKSVLQQMQNDSCKQTKEYKTKLNSCHKQVYRMCPTAMYKDVFIVTPAILNFLLFHFIIITLQNG